MGVVRSLAVGRADFQEHAEAIGVPTDQIFFSRPHPSEGVMVVFNLIPYDHADPPPWWGAWLVRDSDGIFQEKGRWELEAYTDTQT